MLHLRTRVTSLFDGRKTKNHPWTFLEPEKTIGGGEQQEGTGIAAPKWKSKPQKKKELQDIQGL